MKLQRLEMDCPPLQLLEKHIEKPLQRIVQAPNAKRSDSSTAFPEDGLVPGKLSTIPALIGGSKRSLEHASPESLQNALNPVLEGLRSLDATEILELERLSSLAGGAAIGNSDFVKPIHDDISPTCESNTVRYIHLSEAKDMYSIGVFVFPPFSSIPLHDHPGMCVLSRVLYGKLTRRSLDIARKPPSKTDLAPSPSQKSWFTWGRTAPDESLPEGTKYTCCSTIDELNAPDCTMLFPFEGNLHEFVAGEQGAAVLDVLLPPYDPDHHRDCTFYETRPCVSENSSTFAESSTVEGFWAVPIKQPTEFHCISGNYKGLGGST